jgi:hypothetical protein
MKETIEEVAETIAKGFGSENWQEIKDGIIRYAVDEKHQENNFFESLRKAYEKESVKDDRLSLDEQIKRDSVFIVGFTAGTKSEAARNYWFEEFQNKLI